MITARRIVHTAASLPLSTPIASMIVALLGATAPLACGKGAAVGAQAPLDGSPAIVDAAGDLPVAAPDAGGDQGDGDSAGSDSAGSDSAGSDRAGSDSAGSDSGGSDAAPALPTVVEALDLADVWSGHPVGFALVTTGDQQLAAFYDANRQMTVAQRTLGEVTWRLTTLATTLGWDSHNYVAMAVDAGGFIHVSGNMHGVPLIYFRSMRPLDITSFVRVPAMVGTGSNEQSCTYPQFFLSPSGALVFAYRDGASGNGNYIFNIYDVTTRVWTRLLNTPLLDGEGLRSAYPVGPILGPDGWYHLVWVWRETPDAATNHDLSYARSRDLVSWQTAAGVALTLPIRLATGDIVDPVPPMGGMINNNTKIGFDAANRAVVAYHKYVADGSTQLYNARFENGAWTPHQASSWTYRWNFGGTGTLVFDIQVEPLKTRPGGGLTQEWYNAHEGGWGAFRLDPATLAATATIDPPLPYPTALATAQSPTPGMVVRWAFDSGAGPDPGMLYMLRWETLESNRDMPLPAGTPIPAPTRLRLYGIRQPR